MYGYWLRHYWQLSIYTIMDEPLFNAIYKEYSISALQGIITDLYNTEAPDKAVYPYATFQAVSATPENFASDKKFLETYLMQFSLFDKAATQDTILLAYSHLVASFDFAELIVSPYTMISCVREGTTRARIESEVWQINVLYRIKLKDQS